jgi:hypothetical protein
MTAAHEHRIACPRCPLGSHRTAAAAGAAEGERRPPTYPDRAALGGIVFVLARSRLGDIRDLRAMGSRDLMP